VVDRKKSQHFRPLRVLEVWDETPGLRGVRLETDPAFLELHQHPGQLIQVQAPGKKPGLYALANGPGSGRTTELLIRRGSSAGDAIVAAARPGAFLEASEPHGPGFSMEDALGRDVLLMATGAGITPIRALIQHLVERRGEIARVRLLYGQRLETDFAYRQEHAGWERANIRVLLYSSRPSLDWRGRHGHVQDALREPNFAGPLNNTVVYLSGHPTMIESARDQLSLRGIPPSQIHLNF
jgi:NAD(P)H-flavin reductase